MTRDVEIVKPRTEPPSLADLFERIRLSQPAWYISSGDLRAVEHGADPADAFLHAVARHRPQSLGYIFSALREGQQDGDSTTQYQSTESVLGRLAQAKER